MASPPAKKKHMPWTNMAIGGAIQVFEVSTLGQPFEVLKTHMAAHRGHSLGRAVRETYARGGLSGFYQGLVPWAWIEASTKGGILLLASSEIEHRLRSAAVPLLSPSAIGILSGMGGGLAQAYTTMGFCTFMKTVEVTRHKGVAATAAGSHHPSTYAVAREIWQREGIRGVNRGVSAVALRQMTNWGSRFGIARITEELIRSAKRLSTGEKLAASVVGGALGCWNQPIEVIRVEMQRQGGGALVKERLGIWQTARIIYGEHGMRGFYRGVIPRIGLSVYLTVCMVFGGDEIKERFYEK